MDAPFPHNLNLTAVSRWPTRLPDATVQHVTQRPVPAFPRAADQPPEVTVVVVTWNGLAFNRLCLESVLAHTDRPLELIVVDNGSTDGTCKYLMELAAQHSCVWLVLNEHNRGFAAANNQALAVARGKYVILLNSDTLVPPGWLSSLIATLDNDQVGLAGPVTNRCGNEQEIVTDYQNYGEFLQFATEYQKAHATESQACDRLIMFCVGARREVWQKIGPLDERYRIGMFEDDDYCERVRAAGYELRCVEGSLVHHFGQASIGKLAPSGEYGSLFHTNRRHWEAKWGRVWQPYRRRINPQYENAVALLLATAQQLIPPAAVTLVISKGDPALLVWESAVARHFPAQANGEYSGHHPADGPAALADLQAQIAAGARYLILPAASLWWLAHYVEFAAWLQDRSIPLFAEDTVGHIYQLS